MISVARVQTLRQDCKNKSHQCHSTSPGNLSNPRIEPLSPALQSPALQVNSLATEPPGKPVKYLNWKELFQAQNPLGIVPRGSEELSGAFWA